MAEMPDAIDDDGGQGAAPLVVEGLIDDDEADVT
jgi:hypothetical protein